MMVCKPTYKKMLVGLPGKTISSMYDVVLPCFFVEKAGEWYLYEFDRDDNMNTLMMNDIVVAAIIPLCSKPFCSVGVGFGYLNTH